MTCTDLLQRSKKPVSGLYSRLWYNVLVTIHSYVERDLYTVHYYVYSMLINFFPPQEFSKDMLDKITAEFGAPPDASTSSKN